MNLPALLVFAAAALVGTLGAVHLVYTFRGHRLDPRDPALRSAMQASTLVITRQTTVWRAVRGFNATHSLGLLLFALVYAHLALRHPAMLHGASYLALLGMAVLLAYLVLARRYFFSVPFRGVAVACALYAAGWALA